MSHDIKKESEFIMAGGPLTIEQQKLSAEIQSMVSDAWEEIKSTSLSSPQIFQPEEEVE